MNYRWIGAILVMIGCGSYGFSMASRCRLEEQMLRHLGRIAEYMKNELQYSLTPLPELCRASAGEATGQLRKLFLCLGYALDRQMLPDVNSCMQVTVDQYPELPRSVKRILLQMGRTLGAYDLSGQVNELKSIQHDCERELNVMESNRDMRLRNYRTLGLCTGAALAILFI